MPLLKIKKNSYCTTLQRASMGTFPRGHEPLQPPEHWAEPSWPLGTRSQKGALHPAGTGASPWEGSPQAQPTEPSKAEALDGGSLRGGWHGPLFHPFQAVLASRSPRPRTALGAAAARPSS